VSAEKVELVYVNSPFVMQIFVYGDSNRNFLVAVVVPDEGFVRKSWNGEGGLDEKALWKDVCASEGLNKRVLADMDEKAKEFGLLGFEVVKRIHLEPVPWTSEDLLTPTQKLMRFQARKRYESVIEKLYLD
jgi:long-chain acyl-CoA synthetase